LGANVTAPRFTGVDP